MGDGEGPWAAGAGVGCWVPLGWPWLAGWSWLPDMVFLSCRAAWAGFVVGGGSRRGLLVWCAAPRARCPGPPGSCSPVCSFGMPCCVCGVLGQLASVHRCVRFGVLCRVHGVLGHLAPVHRCARSVCGVACAVSRVGMQVRIRTISLEFELARNSHEFVDCSELEFATSNSNPP